MKKYDKKIWYSIVLALILIFLHTWQFIKSGYQINPMINLIATVIYIPVILIFRFNGLPMFLMCYGFLYLPFESFDNYTSLLLVLSAISLNKHLNKFIWVYVLETIVCYINKGLEISHIAISVCYIAFLWNVYVVIQNNNSEVEPLMLNKDEEFILEQLITGCEIKEVTGFSQNTVYKKLKNARERNNCITNDELILRYKTNKK